MGATGIYFDGTAADARKKAVAILTNNFFVDGITIADFAFAKEGGDTQIYCALKKKGVTFAYVFNFCYYKKNRELIYRTESEFVGSIWKNCPAKILNQLSPVEEIQKTLDISDEEAKWAADWRKACHFNLAEKNRQKALQKKLKKAVSIERTGNPFKIKTSVNTYNYWSLSDFKISGKFLKTGTCNFDCGNTKTAKFFLQEFQKAFLSEKAGYNTITMTAF